jgi:hypothetical protein
MLLIQLVVIVFKHSVKSLGFPKCERLDEKASPKSILSCILLKKPRIILLELLVVIVFKHSVKSLGFPKCERFRGILYFVKQIILFISYMAKVAFLSIFGKGLRQGLG